MKEIEADYVEPRIKDKETKMNWTGKTYIYCTQAKPFLVRTSRKYKLYSTLFNKRYGVESNGELNGSIVAECDVKEAFFLKDFDGVKYAENPIMHEHETLGHRHCLTEKELASYGKGKDLYAYHLENVNPVELHLSDFYEDEACTKPLTKAPQSYRFAYQKVLDMIQMTEGDEDEPPVFAAGLVSEKVLIFSDHAQNCAKILNGEKDLEVRKTRIKGVQYK